MKVYEIIKSHLRFGIYKLKRIQRGQFSTSDHYKSRSGGGLGEWCQHVWEAGEPALKLLARLVGDTPAGRTCPPCGPLRRKQKRVDALSCHEACLQSSQEDHKTNLVTKDPDRT